MLQRRFISRKASGWSYRAVDGHNARPPLQISISTRFSWLLKSFYITGLLCTPNHVCFSFLILFCLSHHLPPSPTSTARPPPTPPTCCLKKSLQICLSLHLASALFPFRQKYLKRSHRWALSASIKSRRPILKKQNKSKQMSETN